METTSPPNLVALNAAHSLQDELRFVAGPGGLPFIDVRNAHAVATVSVYGGQVLSYQPQGAADVLFLSEQAQYIAGKAIRGGVPVCWPWFGPDPQGLGRPAHGLARTRLWSVLGTQALPNGATRIALGLADTESTRAVWPHRFELILEITVGRTLQLALTTRNVGEASFVVTQALHSYFAVGDIARTAVVGLDGCRYTDNAADAGGAIKVQHGPVEIDAEVDRVYEVEPAAALKLIDRAARREIRVTAQGSRCAVVWNPWAGIAAAMADLDDDAYQRFVCVETANAGGDLVTVWPGAEHRLVAEMSLQPSPA